MARLVKKHTLLHATLLGLGIVCSSTLFAATPMDLHHKSLAAVMSASHVKEVTRTVSANKTLHIRIQQYYASYPVFGADAVVHIPNGAKAAPTLLAAAKTSKVSMNGTLYQALDQDLAGKPAFTQVQAQKALKMAIETYQQRVGAKPGISQQAAQEIVFVDSANKAHYAYKVSFFAEQLREGMTPEIPTYIMDAASLQVYQEWNDLHTALADPVMDSVTGGGYGGNLKTGQYVYDGAPSHLAAFNISRDAASNTCYVQNDLARVKRNKPNNVVVTFPCAATDPAHGGVYWSGALGEIAGGYSPINDAMYNSHVVREMFQNWYGLPVIAKDGKASLLTMIFGYKMGNAFYSGGVLSMGDGGFWYFHPWTTRDVMAHEMSHGFTEQYSKLIYTGQSGGLNESFGDITAKAVQVYADGTNSWEFGADVVTVKNEALRYFEQPSRDCQSKVKPDMCSIDNMSEYNTKLGSHQLAGIFNRAFFLWATSPGWNTKKAYDVMVGANMHYWTSNTNFDQAACGVLNSARDLGYSTAAIMNAFTQVGVNTSGC